MFGSHENAYTNERERERERERWVIGYNINIQHNLDFERYLLDGWLFFNCSNKEVVHMTKTP